MIARSRARASSLGCLSRRGFFFAFILSTAFVGCGGNTPAARSSETNKNSASGAAAAAAEEHAKADYRILFVGNSHTSFHDLPNLISKMIRFQQPEKTVYVRVQSLGFLESLANNDLGKRLLKEMKWTTVVLQAQKISSSGKYSYSTSEGVDFAKAAKVLGARVLFYSEWGLKGVKGHTDFTEAVYQSMAKETGGEVARVGQAWEHALAADKEVPLYASDGNHQSSTGAFLTACTLCGSITGQSPVMLADFPYDAIPPDLRKRLVQSAKHALDLKK